MSRAPGMQPDGGYAMFSRSEGSCVRNGDGMIFCFGTGVRVEYRKEHKAADVAPAAKYSRGRRCGGTLKEMRRDMLDQRLGVAILLPTRCMHRGFEDISLAAAMKVARG